MLANTKKTAYVDEEQNYVKREFSLIQGGKNKQKQKENLLRKEKTLAMAGVFVVFAIGFLYTFLAAQIMHQGYKINEVRSEIATVENANQRLQLEIESLRSLDRIEKIATTELNMVQPANDGITYVAMADFNAAAAPTAAVATPQVEVLSAKETHPLLANLTKFFRTYFFTGRSGFGSQSLT